MNDYSKRKLDDTYLVIYAIRNEINIKINFILEYLIIILKTYLNHHSFE